MCRGKSSRVSTLSPRLHLAGTHLSLASALPRRHIMGDETAIGSAGASDRQGHPRGGSGEQSPLQARAQFLKNRSWELVTSLNQGACARGSAQHGINPETEAGQLEFRID